ncbi:MAG TPA: putative lipid II flippase FtsW [Candidatus Bipolaricaulota bacterium]|nr:putative lipid II flippase FtsW [Candidatus Bipolaricaulota bacterium]
MIKKQKTSYHRPDYILIGLFGAILLFGLIILTSASSAAGFEKFNDSYHFIKQQLFHGFLPGIVLLILLSLINYQRWKKSIGPLFIVSLILLLSVFLPGVGVEYGGAKSWIDLGGFSFQPSELVKLTFLMYLSIWLSRRNKDDIKNFKSGFLPFIFIIGIISILMALQPDIGTLFVILASAIIVYFASGAKISHLTTIAAAGAGLILLLIKISPYRSARLMTFLHPELDPQGIGYHINQAFLAIGSGGLFGRGFGHSRQKFQYLPEVTGDSIFAIVCEELGYFFALLLIGLFIALFIRILKMADKCSDPFGRLLAIGIGSWFIVQAFVNVAAMVGLAPMTGVPLPLVSHGGTALAINMAAFGILINISRQTRA